MIKIKESIEKLFLKMNEDKVFAEKILTQMEKEKIIQLAAEEGINITLEDIDEANTYIQKALELKQTEGELSEEELENVAGGTAIVTAIVGLFLTGLTISGIATASASVTITLTVEK